MSGARKMVAMLGASMILIGGTLVSSPAIADPGIPAVIDVTDAPYSAVGDGVTDDSAALQRAVDDAEGTGATVVIPADKIFLTSGIQIGSDTTLQVDGTLLQSQDPASYTYAVAHGHRPGPLKNDLSMFQNLPFVFATHAQNVAVTGDGVVQLTRAATEALTIHTVGIGFFEVTGFEIRDVEVLGSSAYSLALYSSRQGIVADMRIIPGSHYGSTPNVADANTDGISIMNAQHIRVTGNYIRASDDGIYIVANYADPRGVGRWWSTEVPEASRFIEFDNNDVAITCCKAFTFIAWGIDAPDQQTVEISDIYVHDNKLQASGDAVGCWCDARYPNSDASEGQSSITRVVFENNEYIGRVDNTFNTALITDLKTDFGALGARSIQNGDFEFTGTAWWSTSGATDTVGAVDSTTAMTLSHTAARTALVEMDGTVGFLQPSSSDPVRLYQGLGLHSQAISGVPFDTSRYVMSADVVTSGDPVRVFAHDTCTGQDIAERTVTSDIRTTVNLAFTVSAACDNIQFGFETQGDGSWALVDNVAVASAVRAIDDPDPSLVYVGAWQKYSNADAWGGTNMVSRVAGEYLEVPFNGARAILLGGIDHNLGIVDVYLDGEFVASADLYSPTKQLGQITYDTGEIADGDHVLRLVNSGTRNPASVGAIITFDALLIASDASDEVAPTVSLAAAPEGDSGWLVAGAELSVVATDADSGVDVVEYRIGDGAWVTYTAPVALADGEYAVSARATDVAGNLSAAVTQAVKVDSQAPEAWAWTGVDGAVSALARDAGPSGVDRIEYSLDSGVTWLEGMNALITQVPDPTGFLYRATDVAGNISDAKTVTATPPSVEIVADDRLLVEFSGFPAGVEVHVDLHPASVRLGDFAANDLGVVSEIVTVPSTFVSGVQTLAASAPDDVPPVASMSVAPEGDGGWLVAGAELSVTATDADSGVDTVEYRIGDGAWTVYTGSVALADGEYAVSARATDLAGNVSEVVSRSVNVDSQAPEVWVWVEKDGAVSAFARDAGLSGVDRIEYSLDSGVTWLEGLTALIAEASNPTGFLYRAVDIAGNASAVKTATSTVLDVEVAAGDRVLVEFSGFSAGVEVHVELHSDPVRLGTFVANSLGVVSAMTTVPASFASGSHSLVALVDSSAAGDGSLVNTGAEVTPLFIGGVLALVLGMTALTIARVRRAVRMP